MLSSSNEDLCSVLGHLTLDQGEGSIDHQKTTDMFDGYVMADSPEDALQTNVEENNMYQLGFLQKKYFKVTTVQPNLKVCPQE